MNTHSSLLARAWLIFSFCAGGAAAVFAQAPASPTKDEAIVLDRFVVTGSHLATPPDANPTTVIGVKDIERSGVDSNILDLLRKQMPAFSGSSNIGLSNAGTGVTNSYGGSKLSLHNMPTLVLLNGRRVATNGSNARGGSSFVDVGMFPFAAIERIEIVSDGASAIYGSDAIGGVVNIILKSNFNGSEVGGRYAFSTGTGAYSERSAYFTTGASNERVSIIASGNYAKSTPLFQSDRSFSSRSIVGSSFSGLVGTMYLDKSLSSPSQRVPVGLNATASSLSATGAYITGSDTLNLSPYYTLLAGREQTSLYTGLTVKLIDRKLEAFGDVLYSRAQNFAQLAAQNATLSAAAGTPYNPTTANVSSISFRYLPAPRQYLTDAEGLRFTGGLKGEMASNWNWESAYTYSRNTLVSKLANVLYSPNLSRAVLGGYDQNGNVTPGGAYSRVYSESSANYVIQPALDPFARPDAVNPASLANILGTARADFRSTLDSVDAMLRGRPYELPADRIDVAAGGDLRTESLSGMPDDNTSSGRWSGATAFSPFAQSRRVQSAFAEVRLPVTGPKWNMAGIHALDLSAAYRVENYSDAGSSSVPKYSVRWQPIDEQVTVRYTYAKSFMAPSLFDLFGPRTQIFSNTTAIDGVGRSVNLQQGSNQDLKPTKSTSNSVGIVLTPKAVRGLRLSVDYLDAKIAGYVGTVGTGTIIQSVEQLGAASPYASQVALYAFPGKDGAAPITTPGQLKAFLAGGGAASDIYISDSKRNHVGAKMRCVDVNLDYTWKTRDIGELEFGTRGTYFLDDKIQTLPTSSYYEYAGHVTSIEGTIPGYRFYTTTAWRDAGWEVAIGNTYVPPVTDTNTGGSAASPEVRVYSYMTWDLSVAYSMTLQHTKILGLGKEVALRVGANNLTNEMPPATFYNFSPATAQPGADTATYSPIGRLYYVSAGLKF